MTFTDKDFNPSKSLEVTAIKECAWRLSEAIVKLCPEGPLKDKALIDTKSASMFAVKSLSN